MSGRLCPHPVPRAGRRRLYPPLSMKRFRILIPTLAEPGPHIDYRHGTELPLPQEADDVLHVAEGLPQDAATAAVVLAVLSHGPRQPGWSYRAVWTDERGFGGFVTSDHPAVTHAAVLLGLDDWTEPPARSDLARIRDQLIRHPRFFPALSTAGPAS